MNLYRRFKTFISQLDFHEIDKIVANYFYKTNIHNQLLEAKTHHERLTLIGNDAFAYDLHVYYGQKHYGNKFKKYFERGYIVDYVDINLKKSYEPYSMRLLYVGIFISYVIFCYNMSIIYCILISIPLIISIIMYEYCFYTYKKEKQYMILYMMIYISLLILTIAILIGIYLTRHTLYFMTDYIWNYKFNIQQYFTIDEKLLFIKEYFMFKCQHLNINQKLELLKIFKTISFEDLLKNATIKEIKLYVDNLITIFEKLDEEIYPSLKEHIQNKDDIAQGMTNQ